ncbi:MAG: hypothetical protein ACYDHX_09560 [Methanothrix sp.]
MVFEITSIDLSGSGTTAEWATLIVALLALIAAIFFAYRQNAIMKKQLTIVEDQEKEKKWREKKAILVACAKKLPHSYSTGGYVIEIQNHGNGAATDVETLINGKAISESTDITLKQKNISNVAPKDSITYRLNDLPSVGIDISISWTDGTGIHDHYENTLIMY